MTIVYEEGLYQVLRYAQGRNPVTFRLRHGTPAEPPNGLCRFEGMDDDMHQKMRIQYALKERDARIACSIVEMLRSVADIIDHSSPQVLESIIDYINDIQKGHETGPRHRRVIRDAIKEYVDQALQEQRRTERMLHYGITGETDSPARLSISSETVKDNDTR